MDPSASRLHRLPQEDQDLGDNRLLGTFETASSAVRALGLVPSGAQPVKSFVFFRAPWMDP